MFIPDQSMFCHFPILAKFNCAKKLVLDIVIVAQNRHMVSYLESKSYSKYWIYELEIQILTWHSNANSVVCCRPIKILYLAQIIVWQIDCNASSVNQGMFSHTDP